MLFWRPSSPTLPRRVLSLLRRATRGATCKSAPGLCGMDPKRALYIPLICSMHPTQWQSTDAPVAFPSSPGLIPSMSEASEYAAMRSGALLIDRGDRVRIRFGGPRAAELVTGLVTSDVLSLSPGEGQYAGALTAKGKVDRKSTRLNSSHSQISYAVFCL